MIAVSDFTVGTKFTRLDNDGRKVTVTILRDSEPWEDIFGRAMLKFWARREDTRQEGYVTFGPEGHAEAPGETMKTIVLMTRRANIARTTRVSYPTESVGGRYQHVWSLAQREAWLRGRAERLNIVTNRRQENG